MTHGHKRGIPPGYWIVGGIVALLLIFFFLVPAFKGYKVYKAMQDAEVPSEYVSDMAALSDENLRLQTELRSTEEVKENALAGQAVAEENLVKCETDLSTCGEDAAKKQKICDQLADSLAEEKSEVQKQLTACEEATEGVLADAANQLCCIKKTFDGSIKGYEIGDDEVLCVSAGGEPLSC